MLKSLAKVEPAFGRGESFIIDGQPLELILVKNPSGFRISLASQNNPRAATMIAINDRHADGRDMSWLWDVDFSMFNEVEMVSGVRAFDMTLRLEYQNISAKEVEPDLKLALTDFLKSSSGQPKQIFASYTAMLDLRKMIKNMTKVEKQK